MTTSLLHVSMFTFLAALALDYRKILDYVHVDMHENPLRLLRRFRPIFKSSMSAKQYEDRIAIKDPYDIFDTIHSHPPTRIHQPIHVIPIESIVLEPENTTDSQDRCYRMPFGALSDRTIIFADQRTLVKTTKSVISDLRRDALCIAILATGDTTMRVFIYDMCEDAFFIKVTSIYRQSEFRHESITLEHAILYIVK